jgi:hypothetical protein
VVFYRRALVKREVREFDGLVPCFPQFPLLFSWRIAYVRNYFLSQKLDNMRKKKKIGRPRSGKVSMTMRLNPDVIQKLRDLANVVIETRYEDNLEGFERFKRWGKFPYGEIVSAALLFFFDDGATKEGQERILETIAHIQLPDCDARIDDDIDDALDNQLRAWFDDYDTI